MARVTKTFTVSLLPDMFEELEKARVVEHRTSSELIHEALRSYFAFRQQDPTPMLDLTAHADKA